MTWVASIFSALALFQFVLVHDRDATPPLMIATCTVTALAWIWRMQLARARAEIREDERFIGELRQVNRANLARAREEAAFREISRYLEDH
ncbi:hypothetical protein ACIBCH_09610 [Amycolatopsis thailandensis]|uniref:hypothetical protein n=1 Tax=Amycolatopsis thailandensis TaxID=589330 RepID=UPI003796BCB8